ncbi:MAG: hypothetical protein AAGA66_02445 [Bacteroidota bacterium]
MDKKILISSVVLFIACISTVDAQSGWNWGDQPEVAKEKNVLYTDALKSKNYQAAIEPLTWLLTNTPDLNPSIYINGVKIYEGLIKQETDPAKKEELIQKGLQLHDTRIEKFGKEADVTDRKSTFAYRYYSKDKTKYPYLYELYTKAFKLRGANMNSGNLVAYMNVVYKHRFAGGEVSDEEVIDTYSNISDALNTQKSRVSGEKKAKYDKLMGQVDRLLTATKVEISCEFIETKLGPKLGEGSDLNLAKKIFHLMLQGKCLDSPLALKAAGIVQASEPTYGIAKFMAQKNSIEGKDEEAIKLFEQAAELTEENTEKAEVYVSIARIQSGNGQKSSARNSARRALSFDPAQKDAYKLIGNLYMTSAKDCNKGVSRVEDRAIYIAAYEQYRKAGDAAGMANAKAQFPSIEEIFNEGKEEGESLTIGCWINTTVKLEKRPAN